MPFSPKSLSNVKLQAYPGRRPCRRSRKNISDMATNSINWRRSLSLFVSIFLLLSLFLVLSLLLLPFFSFFSLSPSFCQPDTCRHTHTHRHTQTHTHTHTHNTHSLILPAACSASHLRAPPPSSLFLSSYLKAHIQRHTY